MTLIAVAGFQHETNTFAPTRADFDAFERADAWPALSRGPAMIEAVNGINLPAAGFIEAARAQGAAIEPLVWCSAVPSAQVTQDAFERIAAMIVEDLQAALAKGPLDAVYLDLHGAMVCEHKEDGEGELLRRLRRVVKDTPIIASLDLHANTTRLMAEEADALVAYRTYPHIDMAETGARAFALLERRLRAGKRPALAMRKLDFLIALASQTTLAEPARTLYRDLGDMTGEGLWNVSFTPGFPPADIFECGPSVIAVADDQSRYAFIGLHKATNPFGAVSEPLLMVYDAKSLKKIRSHVADGGVGIGWRVFFLPDGQLLGCCGGSSGGFLSFWKPDQDKEIHRFALPNILRGADLSKDRSTVLTSHHDGNIRLVTLT